MKDNRKTNAPGGAGRPKRSFQTRTNSPSSSQGTYRPSRPASDRKYVPSRSAKRLLDDVLEVSHVEDRPRREPRSFEGQDRFERPERPEEVRLHRFLAMCGVASRRAAEALIAEGRVEVNGDLVIEMGVKVRPGHDDVRVDGVPVREEKPHYILLNKPKGVVTTLSDPRRRPTVADYLPDLGVMLRPVGRLDMDSEGLLICTNDGNLADRLTHPKFGVEKEYDVIVLGDVEDKLIQRLRDGVFIQGKWTAEAFVEKVSYERRTNTTKLRMIIHEGRNRQIRLMCESVGHPVESLERVRIGPLTNRGMRAGEARVISVAEREALWVASGPKARDTWLEERLGKKPAVKRFDRPRRQDEAAGEASGEGRERSYPRREDGEQRPYQRREGDSRPYQRRNGEYQRRDGDSHPYQRRDDGDRKPYQRRDGDSRPYQRRDDGDRKPFQRRDGDSRPYQRRDDGDRKPYQRRDGDARPYQRRDDGDRKPYQRRDGDARPYQRRDDGDRKPFQRRDGDARPYQRRDDGDHKPYQRRDGDARPYQRRDDGDRKPYQRRDGDSRPYQRRDDGDRKPYQRRDGDARPYQRRDDGDRKPYQRRDGDARPYQRRDDGDRKPYQKRDGDGRPYQPRTEGDRKPYQKREGNARPYQKRDGGSGKPYQKGGQGSARPPYKRKPKA